MTGIINSLDTLWNWMSILEWFGFIEKNKAWLVYSDLFNISLGE